MDSLLHRVKRSLAMRGPAGTVLMCGAILRQTFAPNYRRIEKRRRHMDAAFDSQYGVDTGGIIRPRPEAVVGTHWECGITYQAVDPEDFLSALRQVPLQHEQFTFLDLGSGKGRALLLAAQFPFRKVIGVDYCDELNAIARENISVYPAAQRRCAEIEVLCADAAEFTPPAGPIVLFLFNPFGEPVMAKVVENFAASFRQQPRRMVVLYFTPYFSELWLQTGLFRKVQDTPAILDTDPAPV